MRFSSIAIASLFVGLSGLAVPAHAQSVMRVCGTQYEAAKQAGTLGGLTWAQYYQQCRSQLQTGAAAPAPANSNAAAAPAQAPVTMKQCATEWSQDKASGAANGQTWTQYLATCRAKHEAATANTNIGPAWLPWNRPATPAAPAAPAKPPVAANAGMSANELDIKNRCPSDTVVWVNEDSHIYHFSASNYYGRSKRGAYMCEADAKNSGSRAARNEKHP